MEYLYPLVATHRNGNTELLYSFDAVQQFIKKYGRFHEYHKHSFYDFRSHGFITSYYDWIVRDDRGRKVTCDEFITNGYGVRWHKRQAELRHYAELGLPIPRTGCRKAGYKMNHPAKKNSGAGHRNRNRALAIYEAGQYKVKNNVGGRVIPWENYQ